MTTNGKNVTIWYWSPYKKLQKMPAGYPYSGIVIYLCNLVLTSQWSNLVTWKTREASDKLVCQSISAVDIYTDTSMSQYNLNFKQKQYQNQPAKTKYLGYLHIRKNDN